MNCADNRIWSVASLARAMEAERRCLASKYPEVRAYRKKVTPRVVHTLIGTGTDGGHILADDSVSRAGTAALAFRAEKAVVIYALWRLSHSGFVSAGLRRRIAKRLTPSVVAGWRPDRMLVILPHDVTVVNREEAFGTMCVAIDFAAMLGQFTNCMEKAA